MRKVITIIILMLTVRGYGADVVLGKVSDLTWQGSGTAWYSAFGSVATPWVLPEYASSVGRYSYNEATNTSGQVVDSSFIGTNFMTNAVGASGTWIAPSNGMSGYYTFTANGYMKRDSALIPSSSTNYSFAVWSLATRGQANDARRLLEVSDNAGNHELNLQGRTAGGWLLNTYEGSASTVQYLLPVDYVWNLIGVTVTGTYARIYNNGNLSASGTVKTVTGLTRTHIGNVLALTGNYMWYGHIDDVIFWTNSLTASQHLDIYTNTYQTHGWSNSLALSNPTLYSNTVLEILGEYNYPADTSYIGTNHMTSYSGANAYDPAWRANGTNGWWEFGGDDYLRRDAPIVPNSSTNYTIMMWAKYSGSANDGEYYSQGEATGNHEIRFQYYATADKLRFLTYEGGSLIVTLDNYVYATITNWNHIAVSVAGTTATIYTNGVLGTSGTCKTVASTTYTDLGKLYYNSTTFIKGYMDDVRVFNRALSSNEIYSVAYSSTNSHRALP